MIFSSILLRPLVRPLAIAAVLLAGANVAVPVTDAQAQLSTPEQQRGLDRMKASPLDHENTFDYIRASAATRDYEGAIAALERLLIYNPGLTRVKYELGVLYYRIGSYAMALQHFEDAAGDPQLEPGLRARLDAYLPEARKQLQQSRFSGVVVAGLRYNSNVAGVPDSGLLRSFGAVVPSAGPYRARGDTSAVAMAEINHVYDFQTPRLFTWESSFAGYAAAQFRQTDLNASFFDVSTGPRFAVSDDPLVGATLRPYIAGGASTIGGRNYVSSIGGGVALNVPLSPFASLSPGIEARGISVADPAKFGNLGTLNTGSLVTGALAGRWLINDGLTFDGRVSYARNQAEQSFGSNGQWAVGAALRQEFAPPSDLIGVNWSATAFIRYTSVRFDAPNPTLDPVLTRRDGQTRIGLQLDAPFSRTIGLSVTAQHTRNDSNIENFRGNSWSIMAGPAIRF
jgi:hypothetical protein